MREEERERERKGEREREREREDLVMEEYLGRGTLLQHRSAHNQHDQ